MLTSTCSLFIYVTYYEFEITHKSYKTVWRWIPCIIHIFNGNIELNNGLTQDFTSSIIRVLVWCPNINIFFLDSSIQMSESNIYLTTDGFRNWIFNDRLRRIFDTLPFLIFIHHSWNTVKNKSWTSISDNQDLIIINKEHVLCVWSINFIYLRLVREIHFENKLV